MTGDDGKAVVLLSGGLDSATALAIARADGLRAFAISFRYGQRHTVELEAAKRVSSALGAENHVVVDIDLRRFGGSALTSEIGVPKRRSDAQMAQGIPVTYVPARNTIFLSLALAWAESLSARHIYIGVNALDYSGYPDCRPEFIAAFERVANLATRAGTERGDHFRLRAPLIQKSKAQIIQRGLELGVDFSLTSSCYDPDDTGRPCRECDSCLLREKGFREVGVPDPLLKRFSREAPRFQSLRAQ